VLPGRRLLPWYTADGSVATDSSRTNNFQYDEYITAAYVSYENALNKIASGHL
jgi:hypothetical protein